MRLFQTKSFFWVVIMAVVVLLTLVVFIFAEKSKHKDLDTSMYQYNDTKELVRFVYDAALRLQEDGNLSYFEDNRDEFNTENYHLLIYNIDGTCLYNPARQKVVGENVKNRKDIPGKQIYNWFLTELESENNPHCWLHYMHWEPEKLHLIPISSCYFKVKLVDGREFIVGGASSYPHEEKEFVRVIVDSAAQLIKEKGEEAFIEIADPLSIFRYRNVYTFVFDSNYKMIVSPISDHSSSALDLIDCVDEVGNKPFKKAIEDLELADYTWEIFMDKKRYQRKLVKKCLYLRKLVLPDRVLYIGAITDMPVPI